MSRLFALVLVLVGVLVGATVVPQYLGGTTTADAVCNQQLDGDDWGANLAISEDVRNGTRLVCERNGTQRTLTVDIDINTSTGGGDQ